jgi:hypothetical protein
VQHPAAGCVCADKKNADDSDLLALYFRPMRRALTLLVVLAALFLGAASALASFHVGTYGGDLNGERVIFTTDTRHAQGFSWGGRPLFDSAAIENHDGVWRFHTHSTRWQVHGHWIHSASVQGSICALSSDGTCPAEHLHHYTANLKTPK